MKIRISYYIQQVSFTLALLTPLVVLVWPQAQAEIIFCTLYAWVVGVAAAMWNRLTVAE